MKPEDALGVHAEECDRCRKFTNGLVERRCREGQRLAIACLPLGLVRLWTDITVPEGTMRAGTIRRVICKNGDGVEILGPRPNQEPTLLECGEYGWVCGKDDALRRYRAERLGVLQPEPWRVKPAIRSNVATLSEGIGDQK